MPFTASHPAAVLPLVRLGLVPSALVIGSMAPDAPLFGPVPVSYAATHAASGPVTVDVVLGLIAFCVWHGALVAPLAAMSPVEIRSRLPRRRRLPRSMRDALRRFALIVASLAVGA